MSTLVLIMTGMVTIPPVFTGCTEWSIQCGEAGYGGFGGYGGQYLVSQLYIHPCYGTMNKTYIEGLPAQIRRNRKNVLKFTAL